MHESSYRIMAEFVNKYIPRDKEAKVLDVGSQLIDGQQKLGSYKSLFEGRSKVKYTGADMVEGLNVDVVLKSPYDWSNIPANSADFVISGQMLEHVEFPWLTFIEINRALKPGGLCCIIAPSSGIMHNFPLDCYRYYPDGMAALASYASLEIIECYAQWETDKFPGRDPEWRDCVVIAKKRPNTAARRVKNAVKRTAVHMVSRACLDKKEFKSRNPILDPKKYCISRTESGESPKLYLDTGSGFSERETVKLPSVSGVLKKAVFSLETERLKRVRFDPCEKPCIIRNIRFTVGGIEITPRFCNGKTIPGGGMVYIFDHKDPQFVLETDGKNWDDVEVNYELSFISKETAEDILNALK